MNVQVLFILIIIVLLLWLWSGFGSTAGVEGMNGTSPGMSCEMENKNLKMLSKYLALVLRKRDAEKELYRLAQGHAQVYYSPRIEVLDKQIYAMKKEIQKDPEMLKFFQMNLDIVIV